MIKILLVEDDVMIASGLVYALDQEGYQVIHGETVAQVKEIISGNKDDQNESDFDLAILDMQLPDGTGFDIAELLDRNRTKFIFLTVVDDEGNVVRAFETGADDYITKPFRLRELLARIKRSLNQVPIARENKISVNEQNSINGLTIGSSHLPQQTQGSVGGQNSVMSSNSLQNNNWLTIGNVRINITSGKVFLVSDVSENRPIELTSLEYKLLLTFAMNQDQILSRSQILESLWDSAGNFVEDNTLTVYIKRLREKLGSAVSIQTIRGRGYRVDK